MSEQPRTPVTVLGMGLMGTAMAKAFLSAGHSTTVWNRTPEKANPLVDLGAVHATTVAEAIAASPLVVVSLLNDGAVQAALETAAPKLRGRTLVNLTSSSPEQARQRAAWTERLGADYVDGSVMATPAAIGAPDTLLLYSGSERGYRQAEPALAALAGQGTYVGQDPGRAAAFDASLLPMFWLSLFGVSLSLALASAEGIQGVDLVPFAPALTGMLPEMLADTARQLEAGHYPGDETTIASAADAFAQLRAVVAGHGIDTSLLDATDVVMRRAVAAGYGADGLGRLVPMLSAPTEVGTAVSS